jgi:hypothetical protein
MRDNNQTHNLPKGKAHIMCLICSLHAVHSSVAEPHHVDAALNPRKNFDVAPAAPAPTLLYIMPTFLNNQNLHKG